MTDVYKDSLEAARTELEGLLSEESQLELRLSTVRDRAEVLRRTIVGLMTLVGEESDDKVRGITDAIRDVFRGQKDQTFSPLWVRHKLNVANFPLATYKNPLAVIHTTLKRLEEQGEIKSIQRGSKTQYQYLEAMDDIPF